MMALAVAVMVVLALGQAGSPVGAGAGEMMAQQEVELLKEELQRVEQKIEEQDAETDDAIGNNKPEKVTNSYKERKERLVDKEKDLRHQLSALQAKLASPSGAASRTVEGPLTELWRAMKNTEIGRTAF
ncbi:g11879 [Coccomyxa elongata]